MVSICLNKFFAGNYFYVIKILYRIYCNTYCKVNDKCIHMNEKKDKLGNVQNVRDFRSTNL